MLDRAPLTAALLLLPLTSWAQTYDLRELHDKRSRKQAGESEYLETDERDEAEQNVTVAGQPPQSRKKASRASMSKTTVYESVDDEGEPLAFKVVVHRYEDDAGAAPGECSFAFTREGNAWTVKPTDGEPPAALLARMKKKAASKTKRAGEDEERFLYPEGPIEVGGTWTLDAEAIKKALGRDLGSRSVLEAASGTGALTTTSQEDGVTLLHLTIKVRMEFSSFENMPCPEPLVLSVEFSPQLTVDGSPRGTATTTMRMAGTFQPQPGASVTLDASNTKVERLRPAKP